MFFFLFFLRQIVRISSRFVDFCRSLDTDVARFFKEIFSNRREYAKELFIVRKFFTGSNGKKLLLSSFCRYRLAIFKIFLFSFYTYRCFVRFEKKKKLFHLKRIEKGEKKRIFCETRGFPNSFTFYYTTFLSRDEIIMPGLLPSSHHGPHVTSCIATFSANILSPRASPPAPFASRLFARQ